MERRPIRFTVTLICLGFMNTWPHTGKKSKEKRPNAMSSRIKDQIMLSVYVADIMRPKYCSRADLATNVVKLYSVAKRLTLLDKLRRKTPVQTRQAARLLGKAQEISAYLGCKVSIRPEGGLLLQLPGGQSNAKNGMWVIQ